MFDRQLSPGHWLRGELFYKARLTIHEWPTEDDFFGFLTTEPNAEVKLIHPKAMPVILRTADECETWLTAPWDDAKGLQRSLPDGSLQIVGHGKGDPEVS